MPNLTVRDIPDQVYERLRERAASNRRSMSSEIVTLLEEAVLPRPIDVDALIAEAEAVHARFPEPLPDLVSAGRREGRRYEAGVSVVAEPGLDAGDERARKRP